LLNFSLYLCFWPCGVPLTSSLATPPPPNLKLLISFVYYDDDDITMTMMVTVMMMMMMTMHLSAKFFKNYDYYRMQVPARQLLAMHHFWQQ